MKFVVRCFCYGFFSYVIDCQFYWCQEFLVFVFCGLVFFFVEVIVGYV